MKFRTYVILATIATLATVPLVLAIVKGFLSDKTDIIISEINKTIPHESRRISDGLSYFCMCYDFENTKNLPFNNTVLLIEADKMYVIKESETEYTLLWDIYTKDLVYYSYTTFDGENCSSINEESFSRVTTTYNTPLFGVIISPQKEIVTESHGLDVINNVC